MLPHRAEICLNCFDARLHRHERRLIQVDLLELRHLADTSMDSACVRVLWKGIRCERSDGLAAKLQRCFKRIKCTKAKLIIDHIQFLPKRCDNRGPSCLVHLASFIALLSSMRLTAQEPGSLTLSTSSNRPRSGSNPEKSIFAASASITHFAKISLPYWVAV